MTDQTVIIRCFQKDMAAHCLTKISNSGTKRELNKCGCLVSWETLRIRVEFLSLTSQSEVQNNGTLCSFTQKALCSYLFVGRHQADRHTALSAPSPACPSSQEPPHSWLMRTGRRHICRGRISLEFLGHHVAVY